MAGPADFVLNPLPGSVQLATSLFTVSAVGTPVKPSNSTITYSASGDLTGDGWPEVVISGWTYRGWDATGTPTPAPLMVFSTSPAGMKMLDATQLLGTATSPGTAILRIADFTGDGRNDLLMAGHNESGFVPTQSTLFVNNGASFTQKPFGPKVTAHEGEVGDINGDGRLDVVLSAYHTDKTLEPYLFNGFSGWYTANGTGLLVIEVNQGNGVFKALPLAIGQTLEQAKANPQPWTIQNWNAGSASTIADLDNDGKAEVIVIDSFNNANNRGDSAIITDIVLGDTMASGRLIQLPAPYFEDKPKYAGMTHSGFEYSHDVQVQVMDFDNDGQKDIIVSSFVWTDGANPSASILQFLKNKGGLKFEDVTEKVLYNQYLGRSESGHDNVFMDVNGDGFLDIVVPGESKAHAVPKQWTGFSGEQYVAYDKSWSNEVLVNTGNGKFVSVMWDQFHQLTLAQAGLFPASVQPFGAQDGRYFPYMTPDGRLGFVTLQSGYANGGDNLFFFNVEANTKIYTGPGGANPALRGAPGFNESYYLTENPAVAQAVSAGTYASGLDHYLAVGRAQGLAGFAAGATVQGSDGGDVFQLREGAERAFGGLGNDTLNGGSGQDYLRGDEGNDVIVGGDAFDDTHGNMGDDTVSGGAGGDWVVGGKDNDRLLGEDGDDVVYGNLGNDTQFGGSGIDWVRGGQGDDTLDAGAGDDWIAGDKGADTIVGGTGADLFHTHGDAGIDRVLDFNRAEGDRVNLLPGTTYTVAQVGADTVINMTGGGQMTLVGVQTSSLTSGWIFGA